MASGFRKIIPPQPDGSVIQFLMELEGCRRSEGLPPILPLSMLHEAYLTKNYAKEIACHQFTSCVWASLSALRGRMPYILENYVQGQYLIKPEDLGALHDFVSLYGLNDYTENAIRVNYENRMATALVNIDR